MPKVLTEASTITCAHQGTITFTASQQLLKINNQAVLLSSDIASGLVSNCQVKPSQTTKPCTKVVSLISGSATRLSVNGTPVLLETANGLTDGVTPVPSNTWSVQSAGQTKLDAV